MSEDGQFPGERRIPASIRCLKMYPGLSISLEPDPCSGDPEVKITELNTGTPITPIPSKAYQRSSLERIGRQLQGAEGLKCALNPSSIEYNDDANAPKFFGIRDDHTREMNHVDSPACGVVNKPIKELLQRASLGKDQSFYQEEKPIKHFRRSSFGINIGFDHEDNEDLAAARQLKSSSDDTTLCLQKYRRLNMEEPIRLPREDTFAVLAKAREELLHQSLQETTGTDKGVGIQRDVTMEDFICQAYSKDADISSHKINSIEPVGAGDVTSVPYILEVSKKFMEENDMDPGTEMEMNANTLAGKLSDGLGNSGVHHHKMHENGSENITLAGRSSEALGNGGVHHHKRDENGSEDIKVNGMVPIYNAKKTSLHDNLDDYTRRTALGMERLDMQISTLADHSLPMLMPNDEVIETEVDKANDKNMIQSEDLASQFSDSSTKIEDTKSPRIMDDLMGIAKSGILPEAIEAISSCISTYNVLALDSPNQEVENDELPLVQREIKIVGKAPLLLDSLNMEHMETNKGLTSPSLYHTIKPCTSCMGSQGANLSNFQCRLCVLEMSQEAQLLWADIKCRGWLMAMQICLFIIVLFWGGFVEMHLTPPPT